MADFSIELAAERITDSRTKQYFEEVLSSFNNGNYRSAVVMLWTVIICDIVYKLQDLRDVHGDAVATALLQEIQALQDANPRSSEWEATLLERVRARTQLLDAGEYLSAQQIQQFRHLSAHPVLGAHDILYRPNRETARASIRNALEAVLLKPPIFTREVVNEFVLDISARKNALPDDVSLERYIRAKYLPRFVPEIENRLFRSLWKFTFNLDNPDTSANREINFRALSILYRRRSADLLQYMAGQRDYFSTISGGSPAEYLARFVGDHRPVYELLTDAARVMLNQQAATNTDLFISSAFLYDSTRGHIDAVRTRLVAADFDDWDAPSPANWDRFVSQARDAGEEMQVLQLGIELYGESFSFNDADERFAIFIEPYLNRMNLELLELCLQRAQQNGETTMRRRARHDHTMIVEAIRRIDPGFVFEPYPDFARLLLPW